MFNPSTKLERGIFAEDIQAIKEALLEEKINNNSDLKHTLNYAITTLFSHPRILMKMDLRVIKYLVSVGATVDNTEKYNTLNHIIDHTMLYISKCSLN